MMETPMPLRHGKILLRDKKDPFKMIIPIPTQRKKSPCHEGPGDWELNRLKRDLY